jgi:hypothetical protein
VLKPYPDSAIDALIARLDALEARLRERDEQIARLQAEHRALVVACRAGLAMTDLRIAAGAAGRFDGILARSLPQEPGK